MPAANTTRVWEAHDVALLERVALLNVLPRLAVIAGHLPPLHLGDFSRLVRLALG